MGVRRLKQMKREQGHICFCHRPRGKTCFVVLDEINKKQKLTAQKYASGTSSTGGLFKFRTRYVTHRPCMALFVSGEGRLHLHLSPLVLIDVVLQIGSSDAAVP